MKSENCGLLLIDKERGKTSFDVIKVLKKKKRVIKAGHTGTLDKFAEGLLAVLVDKYTRLIPLFSNMDKTYRAVIRFGEQTDTLDIYGKIVKRGGIPSLEDIRGAITNFVGEIEQVPPIFSAVHVEGKRAYRYAMNGERPSLNARKVTIYYFKIAGYNPPDLEVQLKVSKGTYIRAVARDLGEKLNSCAYVTYLKREGIGDFKVDEAKRVDAVKIPDDLISPYDFLKRMDGVECLTVSGEDIRKIKRGIALEKIFGKTFVDKCRESFIYAIFDVTNNLVAVSKKIDNRLKYVAVFNN